MWTVEDLKRWAAACAVDVQVEEAADSTNAWLKRHAPETPLLFVAYRQTAGYGQQGRQWHMRPGCDLVFSFWLPGYGPLGRQPALTPWLAYHLRKQLAPFSQSPLFCKWPNDLYTEAGKVSGTLVEVHEEGLIIGTGINWLRTEPVPNALASIDEGIEHFLAQWSQFLHTQLPQFNQAAWETALAGWQDVDLFKPRQHVQLQDGRPAIYLGPDTQGRLQLWLEGRLQRFASAEISLIQNTRQPGSQFGPEGEHQQQ